jgi:ribosomal protein S18 acetylase RimI-like enzyme
MQGMKHVGTLCQRKAQTEDDMLVIGLHDLFTPEAQTLIAELNEELSAMYPEESANHFRLDPEEVRKGSGAFLIAIDGERHLGCCALRRMDQKTGEIKRMYVRNEARNRGIGRTMLLSIEEEAKALGMTRLVLETGVRQPAAIALYKKAGFVVIPLFGEYAGSPLSVCMEKDLG